MLYRAFMLVAILPILTHLYGCASIVSGQDQVVSVTSPNCPGAECKLVNSDGTFYVKTPGTVSVNRDYDALKVSCQKDGIDPVIIEVDSSTQGMAFGNILLGGVIGAGVDMATGAAYDYPAEIIHPLDCRSEDQIAAAPKQGLHDEQALALVDTAACEEPGFVFLNGAEEIYRSQCLDGKVGVIGCMHGTCRPLNISSRTDTAEKVTLQYVDQVEGWGKDNGCEAEFHAIDVTPDAETWMVMCEAEKFVVVRCESGSCAPRP